MTRELKVYNNFGEMILHLEFVPGDPQPLQILDGTPEMRSAVRALLGADFDRVVVVNKQPQHFTAQWGSPQYIDALAGYWSTNFQWRTRIVDKAPGWAVFANSQLFEFGNAVTLDFVDLRGKMRVNLGALQPRVGEIAEAQSGFSVEFAGTFPTQSEDYSRVLNLEPKPGNMLLVSYDFGLPVDESFPVAVARTNDPTQKPTIWDMASAA